MALKVLHGAYLDVGRHEARMLLSRTGNDEENKVAACVRIEQGTRLQFEGSQLKCGEGCELAESLDKISCLVNGWSPALDVANSFNVSLSCDGLLGHELMVSHATCRGCDQGGGVGLLPHTCS